jgi:hypothetical protein
VLTIEAGSASRTSPSTAQKLTLSSYFSLQAVQYFIREVGSQYQETGSDAPECVV